MSFPGRFSDVNMLDPLDPLALPVELDRFRNPQQLDQQVTTATNSYSNRINDMGTYPDVLNGTNRLNDANIALVEQPTASDANTIKQQRQQLDVQSRKIEQLEHTIGMFKVREGLKNMTLDHLRERIIVQKEKLDKLHLELFEKETEVYVLKAEKEGMEEDKKQLIQEKEKQVKISKEFEKKNAVLEKANKRLQDEVRKLLDESNPKPGSDVDIQDHKPKKRKAGTEKGKKIALNSKEDDHDDEEYDTFEKWLAQTPRS